jgi:hypothetical protein
MFIVCALRHYLQGQTDVLLINGRYKYNFVNKWYEEAPFLKKNLDCRRVPFGIDSIFDAFVIFPACAEKGV